MKYSITKIVNDSPGFIDIDQEEFEHISMSIENLFELLKIEDNFDLIIENFLEYEEELLSISLRNMITHFPDYFGANQSRNTISRRITNLLNTCEMYLDHTPHHLSNIYGKDSITNKLFNDETHHQYDKYFGYRVLESIRNYSKHRGFPIQSISFPGSWIDVNDEEKSRLMYSTIPLINLSKISEDGKRRIKRAIINEMIEKSKKGYIDIRKLIREYIEGISEIQEKIRESMQSDTKNWEDTIDNVFNKYKDKFGEKLITGTLAIVEREDDNHFSIKKTIFTEFIERRHLLENKNQSFVNLTKRFASNVIYDSE